MPKGLHTASVVVLVREAPSLDALARAVARFGPSHTVPPEGDGWMGESGVISVALPGGGRAAVTPFAVPWPDDMGDPAADPALFGAWSMGFFGPYTWPGALERAIQHSYGWPEAGEVAGAHLGFVRILATQATGDDDPVIPASYDALAEMRDVTAIAEAIAALPGALAWFDPNGETLLEPSDIAEAKARNDVPLDLWTNVRMFGAGEGWSMMDTVGLRQLDRDDVELAFRDGLDPNEVANFLRSVSHFLVERGAVIRDGQAVDGPGNQRWQAFSATSLTDPDRAVLRFLPATGDVPEVLRTGIGDDEDDA